MERASRSNRASASRTRFSGSLDDVAVVELFQTLEVNGKDAVVRLRTDAGSGAVWFAGGQVAHAEVDEAAGMTAVYRLLLANGGSFQVDFEPFGRERTVDLPNQHLLMEGMRLRDEWAEFGDGLPAPGVRVRVHAQRRVAWHQDLSEDEVRMLDAVGDGCSVFEAVDAVATDRRQGLKLGRALFERGLLERVEPAGGHGGSMSMSVAMATSAESLVAEVPQGFFVRRYVRHLRDHASNLNMGLHRAAGATVWFGGWAGIVYLDWRPVVGALLIAWSLQLWGHVAEEGRPRRWPGPLDVLVNPLFAATDLLARLGVHLGYAQRARSIADL